MVQVECEVRDQDSGHLVHLLLPVRRDHQQRQLPDLGGRDLWFYSLAALRTVADPGQTLLEKVVDKKNEKLKNIDEGWLIFFVL